MYVTLYNVISEDGFIASKDRKEDFIPDQLWSSFINICNEYDVLIWGKNTYIAFKAYDESLIEQLISLPIKKVILTRDTDFVPESPFKVIHTIDEIPQFGNDILISGSAVLNDLFVEQNMVNNVVVNVVPVSLGEGIPQFSVKPELILVSEKPYDEWTEKRYSKSILQ